MVESITLVKALRQTMRPHSGPAWREEMAAEASCSSSTARSRGGSAVPFFFLQSSSDMPETITSRDAARFPIIASCTLLGLYLFFKVSPCCPGDFILCVITQRTAGRTSISASVPARACWGLLLFPTSQPFSPHGSSSVSSCCLCWSGVWFCCRHTSATLATVCFVFNLLKFIFPVEVKQGSLLKTWKT